MSLSSFLLLVSPAVVFANSPNNSATSTAAPAGCQLAGPIQHVIAIQFDNVHFTHDNPNVPSDLEQMPALLNFIKQNGVLSSNEHTPLISHTANDILTTLTGLYGDQHGVPVTNSYGYFNPNGTSSFTSSFAYWTDRINPLGSPSTDTSYNMITNGGLNTPAPWVAYTRAGCNFGSVATANTELESLFPDVPTVFGQNSMQTKLSLSNPFQASAAFEGLSVHCAAMSTVCSGKNGGVSDILPNEPGGYHGYSALFGNKYIAPIISPSGPMKDLFGNKIQDVNGDIGFPGYDQMFPSVTLSYVAAMQEHGVPITYAYIADAHGNHTGGNPYGPGQAGYVSQLESYNDAFAKFFARLQKDGITTANTLFVITADEGDHFAGGAPTPANCNGVTTPCNYKLIGEVDANLAGLLGTEQHITTSFSAHFDSSPTIYITGNPSADAMVTRNFEQATGKLSVFDPYLNHNITLTRPLADRTEMNLLHMVTSDPARTPTFTLFANPNYFLYTGANNCNSGCTNLDSGFAWNHGDYQPKIVTTFLGIVGPGVKHLGVDQTVWSDHTDIRPTMLMILGLKDDYVSEGRALVEFLKPSVIPMAIDQSFGPLAQVYKEINAPVGPLGLDSLKISTRAMEGSNAQYLSLDNQLKCITTQRNALDSKIIALLNGAEFNGQKINAQQAQSLINSSKALLEQVHDLANGGAALKGCPAAVNGSSASSVASPFVSSAPNSFGPVAAAWQAKEYYP